MGSLCKKLSVFFRSSALSNKDFSRLDVLELGPSDHRHDSEGDGSLVVESTQKLLHQFGVSDAGSDRDSSSDSVFDARGENLKLFGGLLRLVSHTRGRSVEC